MKAPVVSVCVPSFNSAENIEETVRSVFEQSYDNIEIIVTDDGSTDDTVRIVRSLEKISPFPFIFRAMENNRGIAENWNYAVSLASGDYIKLLPADDVIEPGCIASQLDQFCRYGDALALVFCARKIITRSGKHLMTARFYSDRIVPAQDVVRKCILSGINVVGEPGAVLFPRQIAEQAGKFNGTRPYVIDIEYWIRLLEFGDAAAMGDTLCCFRIDNNLSVRLGWSRCTQYLNLIREMDQRWNTGRLAVMWGTIRTVLNEILRRVAHFVFRVIG